MFWLNLVGYLADAWIVGTYLLVQRGHPLSWMNYANAIGCIPIIAVELLTHAYPPLVITAAFGIAGLYGIVRSWRKTGRSFIAPAYVAHDVDGARW